MSGALDWLVAGEGEFDGTGVGVGLAGLVPPAEDASIPPELAPPSESAKVAGARSTKRSNVAMAKVEPMNL